MMHNQFNSQIPVAQVVVQSGQNQTIPVVPVIPTRVVTLTHDTKVFIPIIDKSGSMIEPSAKKGTEGAKFSRMDVVLLSLDFIGNVLDENVLLSVVTYDSNSNIVHDETDGTSGDTRGNFKSKLSSIRPDGGTNIISGLDKAYTIVKRCLEGGVPSENITVVLLTDGQDSSLNFMTIDNRIRSKEYSQKKCFKFETFSFGPDADINLLYKLAKIFSGHYTHCPEISNIGCLTVRLIARFLMGTKAFGIYDGTESVDSSEPINKIQYYQFKNGAIEIMKSIREIHSQYLGNSELESKLESISSQLKSLISDIQRSGCGTNMTPREIFWRELLTNLNMNLLGDITKGLTIQYFKEWGKAYLLSIMEGLEYEYSVNSFDIGVQNFGTQEVQTFIQELDEKYDNMPVPVPKFSSRESYASPQIAVAQATPVFTRFSAYSGSCFHPDSPVYTSNGIMTFDELVKFKELNGKYPRLSSGSEIEVIIFTPNPVGIENSNLYQAVDFYQLGENSMCLPTATHPVKSGNTWVFPKFIGKLQTLIVPGVYNVILKKNTGNTIEIGNYTFVTLGHEITDGSVAQDPFWGTSEVINAYKSIYPEEFVSGYIYANKHCQIRSSDGCVGFELI